MLEVLKRFGIEDCNSVHNPIILGFKILKDEGGVQVDEMYFKQIMGSLIYLTATRPDLMFTVSLISRQMGKPTELHLQAVKRAFEVFKRNH